MYVSRQQPQEKDFESAGDLEFEPGTVELIAGRRAPYSQLGDWVMLSGASAQACKLYWIYVAHINRSRGDNRVWPKREDLAELLGSSVDTVDRYNKELSKLGALDIIARRYSNNLRARNAYRVHETPPAGYAGPLGLSDFYSKRQR